MRTGGLAELSTLSAPDVAGPLLLDIDLDYWGGAAGPQRPAWEAPGVAVCGDYLRLCGAAAWGDARCPAHALWPALLGRATAGAETALRRLNGTAPEACAHALAAAARTRPAREAARLRRALAHGMSPAEAMLAAAPRGASGEEEACERVDERRLLAWLRPLRPRLVTIARSIDGFLPFHCTAQLETAVLRVLAAVAAAFNASLRVEHLPGTASGAALRAMTE